jgi:RNA polymerase primary sigma factor
VSQKTLMNTYLRAEEVSPGLKNYMVEIGQVPLLTPAQEITLARRIQEGDAAARIEMIEANLRLVVKVALNYVNLGLPLPDLIEEGNLGLMQAVERFDPGRGAKFSSYAVWWIKQTIKSALHEQSKTIRLPRHSAVKLLKMNSIALRMSESLGREPTDEELSEELGIDERQIADLKRIGARPCSLDAAISETEEDLLGEIVADDREQTPFETLRDSDLYAKTRRALAVLSERDRQIIRSRFGLDGAESITLGELGRQLGVTAQRTRQLQNAALSKLRRILTQQEVLFGSGLLATA